MLLQPWSLPHCEVTIREPLAASWFRLAAGASWPGAGKALSVTMSYARLAVPPAQLIFPPHPFQPIAIPPIHPALPSIHPALQPHDMLRQALRSGLRASRTLQSGWEAIEAANTRPAAAAASAWLRGFASQVGTVLFAAGPTPAACLLPLPLAAQPVWGVHEAPLRARAWPNSPAQLG